MEALRAIDLQELIEGLVVCLVARALPAARARPDVGAPRRVVGDDGVADRGRSLVWFSHGTSKSERAVVTLRHPARTSPPIRAGHADTIPPIRLSRESRRAEQRLPPRRRRSWCFLCDFSDGSRHPLRFSFLRSRSHPVCLSGSGKPQSGSSLDRVDLG